MPQTMPQTDYEICLMLTRIFLGKEDVNAARNLYFTSRITHTKNNKEEVYDSDSSEETA
jgi:hypothetical protein